MIFDWTEYLKVADDLMTHKQHSASDEAIVRAAVSRAYYAVYHSAHAALVTKGELTAARENAGVHAMVQDALFRINDPAWKRVGVGFEMLRTARVDVDYRPVLPHSWGKDGVDHTITALRLIQQAYRLISLISTLP